MSCSSCSLWMILPEDKNSMALKNAWVQMWKRAMLGWLSPMATIISPSCLVVEYATIFFMSCWEMAVVAAKIAVVDPKIRHQVLKLLASEYAGSSRISRKIPATTMVEL